MINDDTLTLYYFNDGLDTAQRRAVEAALQADAELAARYDVLSAELDALAQPVITPAPEHLAHQWHDRIAREARLERQREATPKRRRVPWLGLGTAFASVLALGIAIGLWLPGDSRVPSQQTGITTQATATVQPVALERGLQLWLRESRSQLAGLDERAGDERTTLLLQIISQNRLFEAAAEKQQAPEVARLMRAIEPILIQLAATDPGTADAEALRRQLGFELNAMLTRLQPDASKPVTTT